MFFVRGGHVAQYISTELTKVTQKYRNDQKNKCTQNPQILQNKLTHPNPHFVQLAGGKKKNNNNKKKNSGGVNTMSRLNGPELFQNLSGEIRAECPDRQS